MNEEHVRRAVEIIRLWQAWASIGKVHEESGDPWPSVGKQAELYGMLRLYVNHGIIDSFVINGIVWKDNEIGDVGRMLQGGTQYESLVEATLLHKH